MRKLNILILLIMIVFSSCEKDAIGNNDPRVYIPRKGVSINDVWERTDNKYIGHINFNVGGIVPSNQNSEINISYEVSQAQIDEYNNDITQEFSGKMEFLPADSYNMNTSVATIPKGEIEVSIPIEFDILKVKQYCVDPEKLYAIPIKIRETDMHNLHDDPGMITAFYCIKLNIPTFYFEANKNATNSVPEVTTKLLYGEEYTGKYEIISNGVPKGEYQLGLAVNPTFLKEGQIILPDDAYDIGNTNLAYKFGEDCNLEVSFDYSKVEFRKSYFLPISITSASEYTPDPVKKDLLVKISVVNEYEKQYGSLMTISSEHTNKSKGYATDKEVISYESDIVELQLITNNTIAGAINTSSSLYNNKYVRIKIIPTEDKSNFGIEYIPINEGLATDTPAEFEMVPGMDNYYDWDYEKFYLNYRWKDKHGKWITVSEILEAK